jgi:hypothetical protein
MKILRQDLFRRPYRRVLVVCLEDEPVGADQCCKLRANNGATAV